MRKKKARSKAKPTKAKTRKPVKPKAKARPKAKKSSRKRSPTKKVSKVEVPVAKSAVIAPPNSVFLGLVDDYYAKVGVIALVLKAPLSLSSRLQVLGHTTNFEQVVDSMQIEHTPVTQAAAGEGVGIKATSRARRGDHVYLLR
jgi:hypothetical protein